MFHCGTMQEVCGNCVKTHAPSEECQRRSRVPDLAAELARVMALIDGVPPTTDNLEQYGKAVARQPIIPEYGTLNPPASPPEVTEEFDGVRWKCLKIVDGDKAIDPYNVRIGGVLTDPYRVARAYGIEDPVIFQALKKLLRCGRKHKAKAADVREAITSLERWEAMNREDQKQ